MKHRMKHFSLILINWSRAQQDLKEENGAKQLSVDCSKLNQLLQINVYLFVDYSKLFNLLQT